MKRLYLLLILLCLIPISADSRMTAVMAGSGAGAAPALACPGDATELIGFSGLNVDYLAIAATANETYVGQANYDPGATDQTICSVDVSVRVAAGTGATIQVEIWEMSGNNLSDTAGTGDCVSDAIAITTANDMAVHSFGGMSCTLDNTKLYGIVLTRSDHGNNASNYVQVYVGAVASWSGQWYEWTAAKAYDTSRNFDLAFDLNGF